MRKNRTHLLKYCAEILENRLLLSAGDLDPTFGTGGKVFVSGQSSANNEALAVAVLPDGRILVGGDRALGSSDKATIEGYLPNGQIDHSFGIGGREVLDVTAVKKIFTEADGSFIVGGSGNPIVTKLDSAGAPVPSWAGPTSDQVGSTSSSFQTIADSGNGRTLVVSTGMVQLNADGSVDTTFGTNGVQLIPPDSFPVTGSFVTKAAAVQSNGGILLAGEFRNANVAAEIRRFLPNGQPDTTFGKIDLSVLGTSSGSLRDIQVLPDNSFLVTGLGGTTTAVAKYSATGVLDPSFGSGGVLIVPNPGFPAAYNIHPNPDGSIFLTGPAIVKLTANGQLDGSFGTGGVMTYSLPPNVGRQFYAAVGNQGSNIIVAATGYVAPGAGEDVIVMRYSANGTLDKSFGNNGFVFSDYLATETVSGPVAAVQSDGKVVLAGGSSGASSDFQAWRVNADGSTDTSFGSGGTVSLNLGGSQEIARAIVQQADGKLVLAGQTDNGNIFNGTPPTLFAQARLNSDGSVDPQLGIHGSFVLDTGGTFQFFSQVAMLPSGNIIAAGLRTFKTSRIPIITRSLTNGLDPNFGVQGILSFDVPGTSDTIVNLWATSDGHIMVEGTVDSGTSGSPNTDDYVARLNGDGTFDPTFGNNGVVILDSGATDDNLLPFRFSDPDAIFVASTAGSVSTTYPLTVTKLTANGSPDPSFGTNGSAVFMLPKSSTRDTVAELAAMPDGRILLTGTHQVTQLTTTDDLLVMRLTATGAPDPAFGVGGQRFYDFGGDELGTHILLAPGGRIIVVGHEVPPGGTTTNFIARLLDDPAAAPVAIVGGPYDADPGGDVHLAGSAIVGSGASVASYEWDFDYDGQNFNVDATGPTASFVAASIFFKRQTVAFRVTDSLGQSALATTTLTVSSNLPPHPNAGVPQSVYEGGQITLTGSATASAGRSIRLYEWDFNFEDGIFHTDATGKTVTYSAAQLDGPANILIAMRVTDSFGATDYDVSSVNILNLAPWGNISVAPTVPLNGPCFLSIKNAVDGGAADTAAGFTYSYDFNNDGVFDVINSPLSGMLVPANYLGTTGVHQFVVRVNDKDGAFTQYSTSTTVLLNGTSSLSGLVYRDITSNGVYNSGVDLPLPNVTVFVDQNFDGVFDTGDVSAVSGPSGTYSISGIKSPNTYNVYAILPNANYVQVFPGAGTPQSVSFSAGLGTFGINFGLRDTTDYSAISGHVYQDTDASQTFNTGDLNISGRVIYFDLNNNGALDTGEPSTTTDASGNYQLKTFTAGTFHVRQVLPADWLQITPLGDGSILVNFATTGLIQLNGNFGSRLGAILEGFVYIDTNSDGERQLSEPPYTAGATVYLDSNNNGALDAGEPTSISSATGAFRFSPLVDGTYNLRIIPPSHWRTTTALGATLFVAVRAGFSTSTNFSITNAPPIALAPSPIVPEGGKVAPSAHDSNEPSGTIVSYEWDLNYDGVTFKPTATGVSTTFDAAGLDGPSTRVIAVRVTDAIGNSAIGTGTVHITNAPPTAVLSASPSVEFDATGTMSFSSVTDPSPADLAAGFTYSYDFNNDGVFEIQGSAASSATIPLAYLGTTGSHTVHGRVSDKDGGFADYTATVTVQPPPPPATVNGMVFGDTNADGMRDPSETGVAGMTVFMDANGNGVHDTGESIAVTDASGNYVLTGILRGTYVLSLPLPAGWTRTDDLSAFAITYGPSTVLSDMDLGVQGPPLPKIGGPYSVAEGSSVTLNATGSSEVGGTISKYEWDTNYNGTTFVARATGVSTSFSAVGLDGPSSRSIALRVTDANNVAAIATGSVTINNAPPKATFAAGGAVTLGSAGSVSFSAASDPSPADVTAGFKYSYDFNNDGTFETANSTSATATVPASYLATTGAHTIHGRIIDKDGGFTDYTTTIQVNAASGGASISGLVYNDANGNGVRDSGEAVISGQKLFIDKNLNSILDAGEPTFTTGAAGTFTFSGLAAGTYRIREVTMSGWRWTNPSSGYFNVTVTTGQIVTGKNFGETTNTLISGIVFKDANANAKLDTGEVALSGWVVYLDTNNNGILDTGEKSFTTGTDGKFSFVVPAGTYHLREVLKSGFTITTPAGGLYTLTLASGQSATGKNFGDK